MTESSGQSGLTSKLLRPTTLPASASHAPTPADSRGPLTCNLVVGQQITLTGSPASGTWSIPGVRFSNWTQSGTLATPVNVSSNPVVFFWIQGGSPPAPYTVSYSERNSGPITTPPWLDAANPYPFGDTSSVVDTPTVNLLGPQQAGYTNVTFNAIFGNYLMWQPTVSGTTFKVPLLYNPWMVSNASAAFVNNTWSVTGGAARGQVAGQQVSSYPTWGGQCPRILRSRASYRNRLYDRARKQERLTTTGSTSS